MQINPSETTRLNKRVGVIDIGSNSVRLVVFELFGASFTPIYNEKVLAGLGRDLHETGKLNPEGAKRAFAALRRFKYLTVARNMHEVLIAATAALRDASDAQEFIDKVRDEIGFDIAPLSGEEEAYASTLGVLAGESRAAGIAADLGGASLELMTIANGKPGEGASYPLGPFSIYQGAYDEQAIAPIVEKFLNGKTLSNIAPGQTLYLIGGAWRNLALIHQKRVEYPLRVAHNYALSTTDAQALGQWASGEGAQELINWPGVSSRRAETLPYSGLLLRILIDQLKPSDIVVAPGGLRDGLIYSTFSEQIRTRNALFDACRDLARGRQQNQLFGPPLINFLKDIEDHLPAAFEPENERRLRKAACYLVGIGKGLHPDHRANMSFKTVLYAPLPSVTHKERAYLALLLYASYTAKINAPNPQATAHLLSPEEQKSAQIYGAAMRLGVVLSGRSGAVLDQQSLKVTDGVLEINVAPEYQGLVVERCLLRLQQFAILAGLKVSSTIS
jgi:exopolyphosphatase/guanosine-5'-triphosphate,3'-diphosphate pyrophosphatase